MPFLTLNGHTFRVVDGSAGRRVSMKGSRSRAYRGQMRDGTRGKRREWNLRTCFEVNGLAETMISTINGEGHLVRFTDSWDAATGLAPEVGVLADVAFDPANAGPFTGFPPGCIQSEGDSTHFIYDFQARDEWTLHAWYQVDGDPDWSVKTIRDDGARWENGTQNDALSSAFGNWNAIMKDGRLTLAGLGGDLTRLRHLAMLPYRAHADFITSWHASTTPWGALPLLRMEGDIIATDHEFVFGEVTGVSYVSRGDVEGFGWVNNSEVIDFRLTEYATTYRSFPSVPGSTVTP